MTLGHAQRALQWGRITVQAWDKDVLKYNDFIAESCEDLTPFYRAAWLHHMPVKAWRMLPTPGRAAAAAAAAAASDDDDDMDMDMDTEDEDDEDTDGGSGGGESDAEGSEAEAVGGGTAAAVRPKKKRPFSCCRDVICCCTAGGACRGWRRGNCCGRRFKWLYKQLRHTTRTENVLRVDANVGWFFAKVIRCLSAVALLRWLLNMLPPTSRPGGAHDPLCGTCTPRGGCHSPLGDPLRAAWWALCYAGRQLRRCLIVAWLASCCLVMLVLTALSTLVCPPTARRSEYQQLESDEHMERLRESSGISKLPFDFIRNALPASPNARWLKMYKRKQPEHGRGQWMTVERGRVLISIDIVPKEQAEAEPVGGGRAEPNRNPYLPKPAGRMRLSLNPFDMCYQVRRVACRVLAQQRVQCLLPRSVSSLRPPAHHALLAAPSRRQAVAPRALLPPLPPC